MRIGIDAREVCGRATGAGRYLGGLLHGWAADGRGHEFVLYAPDAIALPRYFLSALAALGSPRSQAGRYLS